MKIWRWFWLQVWNMSEFYGVPLGGAAPWVFEQMTGMCGEEIEAEVDE